MTKFNPIRYAQSLKDAGMPDLQANIQAESLADAFENNLVSKENLGHVEVRLDDKIDSLREDIKHLEVRLDNKIDTVEAVLSTKINTVDTKLNWLLTLVGLISAIFAVSNILHTFVLPH